MSDDPRQEHGGTSDPGDDPGDAGDGRLSELRTRLAEVGSLPLVERPEVFGAVNEALAAELAAMEEV
ncbi:MAG: hypothetical protein ACRDUY_07035 [Nitriliruptorales bacterium]